MDTVEIVLTASQEQIVQSAYASILIVGGAIILLLAIIAYNSIFRGKQ